MSRLIIFKKKKKWWREKSWKQLYPSPKIASLIVSKECNEYDRKLFREIYLQICTAFVRNFILDRSKAFAKKASILWLFDYCLRTNPNTNTKFANVKPVMVWISNAFFLLKLHIIFYELYILPKRAMRRM